MFIDYQLLRTEIYILLNGILLSSLYHEWHREIIVFCGCFYLFNVDCDPACVPVWSMTGEWHLVQNSDSTDDGVSM